MGKPIFLDTITRAFEIADKAMIEQLHVHAVTCGSKLNQTRFWMGNEQAEVKTYAEADSAVKQAYEWLSQRGLARLRKNKAGWNFIELTPAGAKAFENNCLTLQ